VLKDDVFVGPHVVFTDDPHPMNCPRYQDCKGGAVVRRLARIGANATILPGWFERPYTWPPSAAPEPFDPGDACDDVPPRYEPPSSPSPRYRHRRMAGAGVSTSAGAVVDSSAIEHRAQRCVGRRAVRGGGSGGRALCGCVASIDSSSAGGGS